MSDGQSTAHAPAQDPIKIAIWTMGDKKLELGNHAIKTAMSDRFLQRAQTLASPGDYVWGKSYVSMATAALRDLDEDVKIIKLYFVGHAHADGFFFSGSRNPEQTGYFETSSDGQYLQYDGSGQGSSGSSKDFFDELAKHLAPGFQIGFLACHGAKQAFYTNPATGRDDPKNPIPNGNKGIVSMTAAALSHQGVSGLVFGYSNTYVWWYDDRSGKFTDKIHNDATGNEQTWYNNDIPTAEVPIPVVP